ncbi:MAG TPA: hypothetical protein VF263_15780, partial [Longimicrobiaceae bacterium]
MSASSGRTTGSFLSTIRGRLYAGSALLVFLILSGAVVSFFTLTSLTTAMEERLDSLQKTTEIGSSL